MDLSEYKEVKPHRIKQILWRFVNATLFRMLPSRYLRGLRNQLLKMFGARIPDNCLIYSSCKIWAPWNLEVGKDACVGAEVKLYNKDKIVIGRNAVISEGSYICTASHDINSEAHTLIHKPIIIGDRAWIAAECFIGMGVTIGEGAVVGARGCVFKDVAPWTVVGGNPAKEINKRVIRNNA